MIRTGGKQYKVSEGDVIEVERAGNGSDTFELKPLLLVDDDGKTRAGGDISGATVTAKVVGDARGPKVKIFKYRSKSRYRRNLGHRQPYSRIEISKIKVSKGRSTSRPKKSEDS